MPSVSALAAFAFTITSTVFAQSQATCGPGSPCPSDAPCCSQYGQCGVGAYCLGGCDPIYSFDLNSCAARPVCQSSDYKLTSLDDVMPNTEYLGDASKANWVSSGTPVVYQNDAILLTMAPNTVGTLLMSTHYVWYGEISATLSTSQGAGVVTAFIMMSDVKDEIDFEFVGVDLESAQSNFYFQGIDDYDNEMNLTVSNTVSTQHTYTFNWTPDTLTWAIDGTVGRTLNRNETWNSTDNTYHFPQSPARIELSLWPAGLAKNGQGTVDWAGGLVDWNSPYMSNGYYYAMFSDVNVQCYDPPSGYINEGDQSYMYTSVAGTNNTVAITNNNTILSSFYASGDNPTDNPDASASASASGSAATSAATQATIPGVSGGGARGDSGEDSSGSAASSAAGSASTAASGGSTSFQQGGSSSGTSDGARLGTKDAVAGSAVGLLGFIVAALLM